MAITLEKKDEVLVLRKKKSELPQTAHAHSQVKRK